MVCFQGTKAQSNFLDGYIITSKSDTLYGKIDNKDYYSNSQFCDFKDFKTNTVTRYNPNQISGYRYLNGKYYISKKVNVNKIQTVLFMEYLIKGKLNIFFFQDHDVTNHYYVSKDTLQLEELTYQEGIYEFEGKQMYYQSKPYIGLLNYYTLDCPLMKDDITNINEPTHQNLINFARKYHNLTCKDEACIIYEKKIPHKIKFSLYGGSTIFFSNFSTLKQKIYPSFGFNALFQQSLGREYIYLGIGLFSEGKKTTSLGLFGEKKDGKSTNLIRVPLSINYLSPNQGISPVVTYDLDLNTCILTQAIKLGLKYQVKKLSFIIIGDIKTSFFITPYASSLNLGMIYDFN